MHALYVHVWYLYLIVVRTKQWLFITSSCACVRACVRAWVRACVCVRVCACVCVSFCVLMVISLLLQTDFLVMAVSTHVFKVD